MVKGKVSREASTKVRHKTKSGNGAFQPVACKLGTVLHGGCLRQPVYLPIVQFQDESFANLHPREAWLCRVVTGKATGLDPLKRVATINKLREAITKAMPSETAPTAPAGGISTGDGMNRLGLDFMDSFGLGGPRPVEKAMPNKRRRRD